MTILLEAYSGATSNLKKAEKELDLLVKSLNKQYDTFNDEFYTTKARTVSDDPHLLKATKYLNAEFKFKKLIIDLFLDSPYGPHTIVSPFLFFKGDEKKKDIDVYVYIDVMTLVRYKLTGGELLAIILHEIGHNMDTCAPSKIKFYMKTATTFGMNILVPDIMNKLNRFSNQFIDKLFSNTTIRKFLFTYDRILIEVNSLMRILNISYLPLIAQKSLYQTLNLVHLGYYGERKSDSTAVKYGYGPELVSALTKLEQESKSSPTLAGKITNSNPITGILYDFYDACITLIGLFFSPHPSTVNRANNAIYKLKNDIKDPSIPPQLRKELMREIKELEAMRDYMNSPAFSKGHYYIFRAMANRLVSMGKGRNRNILDLLYPAENYED